MDNTPNADPAEALAAAREVLQRLAAVEESLQKIDEQILLLTKTLEKHTTLLAEIFKGRSRSTRILN
jgi:hypothetical protein